LSRTKVGEPARWARPDFASAGVRTGRAPRSRARNLGWATCLGRKEHRPVFVWASAMEASSAEPEFFCYIYQNFIFFFQNLGSSESLGFVKFRNF
jgi:hypothetical protein